MTNDQVNETDGDVLARMGVDGRAWAQEFVERFGGDEALMHTWFANAIEAGKGSRA